MAFLRVSQIVREVRIIGGPANLRVSQIVKEVRIIDVPTNLRVSQLVREIRIILGSPAAEMDASLGCSFTINQFCEMDAALGCSFTAPGWNGSEIDASLGCSFDLFVGSGPAYAEMDASMGCSFGVPLGVPGSCLQGDGDPGAPSPSSTGPFCYTF